MELIIALVIARFLVNGTVDVVSMITGNQPPSKTFHEVKKDNAEDGPLVRALKAWWADAVEDAGDWRIENRKDRKAERARRRAERRAWVEEMERKTKEEKELPERGEAPPDPHDNTTTEDPPVEEVVPPAEETLPDPPVGEVPPIEETTSVDPDPQVPPVEREPEPRPEPEAATPPVEGTIDPDPAPDPEAGPEIWEADVVEDDPATPVIETAPEPRGPEGPAIPDLQIIQGGVPQEQTDEEWSVYGKPSLYAVPDKEAGEEMANSYTDGNGKVFGSLGAGSPGGGAEAVAVEGGIGAHINWTARTADYQVKAAGHVELVGAEMFRGDNGPERLALVARIQAKHQELRMLYLELHQTLVNDRNTVGDAYAATRNQAGNKEYVTKQG